MLSALRQPVHFFFFFVYSRSRAFAQRKPVHSTVPVRIRAHYFYFAQHRRWCPTSTIGAREAVSVVVCVNVDQTCCYQVCTSSISAYPTLQRSLYSGLLISHVGSGIRCPSIIIFSVHIKYTTLCVRTARTVVPSYGKNVRRVRYLYKQVRSLPCTL